MAQLSFANIFCFSPGKISIQVGYFGWIAFELEKLKRNEGWKVKFPACKCCLSLETDSGNSIVKYKEGISAGFLRRLVWVCFLYSLLHSGGTDLNVYSIHETRAGGINLHPFVWKNALQLYIILFSGLIPVKITMGQHEHYQSGDTTGLCLPATSPTDPTSPAGPAAAYRRHKPGVPMWLWPSLFLNLLLPHEMMYCNFFFNEKVLVSQDGSDVFCSPAADPLHHLLTVKLVYYTPHGGRL